MQNISSFLKQNSDLDYANFNKKFITSKFPILGVRIPCLRKYAKDIEPEYIELENNNLTHEEILLYGFSAAANYKTEEGQLEYLNNLLPYIDNWATCDCIVCSMKKLIGEKSYSFFTNLLSDSREFYIRIGLVGLMRYFLKSNDREIVKNLRKISSEQYYVKMAIAWLLAELAITNFPLARETIKNIDDKFIRNKAISKARESYRITTEQKEELLYLKK